MIRIFIETEFFQDMIKEEKDKWLEARVKTEILKDPSKGDLIPGAGGFRKIRIAKSGTGKSGGYRVIYYDHEKEAKVYLTLIYSKSVKENIDQEVIEFLYNMAKRIKNGKKSNK